MRVTNFLIYTSFIFLSYFFNEAVAISENELLYNNTSTQLVKLLEEITTPQLKPNITSISDKLEECYSLYHHSPSNTLFFLEKVLTHKINNITGSNNTSADIQIRSVEQGLTYATSIQPSYFRKEALMILLKNPYLQLKNLIKIHQKVLTFNTNADIAINDNVNSFVVIPSHPHLQRFLKDSTIIFILFAALADICIDPTMTVCPILVLVGIVSSALWVFQINNIFDGIF